MPLAIDQLNPYISATLVSLKAGISAETIANQFFDYLAVVVGLVATNTTALQQNGTVDYRVFHYQDREKPSWTKDASIVDTHNHIALIFMEGRLGAVVMTDSSRSEDLVQEIETGTHLEHLSLVTPSLLQGAFARGETKTLWLHGVHAPTSARAENKVLSGKELRDALDPMADQTYFFSALRASVTISGKITSLGLSPRKSRIWLGMPKTWDDFTTKMREVFQILGAATELKAAMPILANPIEKGVVPTAAFEVSLLPPEITSEQPTDPKKLETAKFWADAAQFDIQNTTDANVDVSVMVFGQVIGNLKFIIDLTKSPKAIVTIDGKAETGHEKIWGEAKSHCRKKSWLRIHYDSGHTLADGVIFAQNLREVNFEKWDFRDFSSCDVTQEKPVKPGTTASGKARQDFDPTKVGLPGDRSIFTWIATKFDEVSNCWLACDDGAGEIADFIAVDTSASPPKLLLIHAKGSGKDGAQRKLSVSDYEIVCAQAIKNLRRLDRLVLETDFAAGLSKGIGNLVWKARSKQPNRDDMLAAIQTLGANYTREVLVIQPRCRKTELNRVRTKMKSTTQRNADMKRLLQLETLLLSTQSACLNLGAQFRVITDRD